MSLVLQVDILGEFKNLTAATKGAQSQLASMNKRAQTVSATISRAFATIGIGLSLGVIKRELEEASKAAVEDAKSMQLLQTAMENTGKATSSTVAAAEKSIKAMSLQSAVADDQLRPAYQKLFIATGDVTKSNRLMQIALDASAATGKSLDSVSQAMAKSLAGSDTALLKLIPSLKGAKDPMAELERTFAGAAEAAANTDPYQRMTVAFGEIQESVGSMLLPVLADFANWLVDIVPDVQNFFAELSNPTTPIGKAWAGLMNAFVLFGDTFRSVMNNGRTDAETFIGVLKNLENILITVSSLIAGFETTGYAFGKLFSGDFGEFGKVMGMDTLSAQKYINQPKAAGTTNITIQGSQSAQQIKNVLQRSAKATGTRVLGLGGL